MRGNATSTVWHTTRRRRAVDHARHRADRRPTNRLLLLSALSGLLVGALLVASAWVITDGPGTSVEEVAAAPVGGPAPESTGRFARVEDRGDVAAARSQKGPAHSASPAVLDPVLLIGDSLAAGIGTYIDAGLGERPVTIEAAEGRGTGTQVELLSGYADSSAPIWVVSLGTNDNPEDFAALAPDVMALAGDARCVIWFDVWRPYSDEDLNSTLRALTLRHANLHLVPWHESSERHPEWFSGLDVHPSSTGYAARGQMAIDAVQHWCDSR